MTSRGVESVVDTLEGHGRIYSLKKAEDQSDVRLGDLPRTMMILAENALRHGTGQLHDVLEPFKNWLAGQSGDFDFYPARVLLQDYTGVPALVDLAAMRHAAADKGFDPSRINPVIPVDLVIDHSVIVDNFGSQNALLGNMSLEYKRNGERYKFLKWSQNSFKNLRIVPPGQGICHQINLECLSCGVFNRDGTLYPDTLVGADSHTTMINALGVLGWGVGGIEAEAAMLGGAVSIMLPDVIGVRVTGEMSSVSNPTDVVLILTEYLRKAGVVGKFVEFYGPSLSKLTLEDRGTIANMAPEYGAICAFFPVDAETIRYVRLTGRPAEELETYAKAQGLWHEDDEDNKRCYSSVVELDLSLVQPCLAGPKLPQQRVFLTDVAHSVSKLMSDDSSENALLAKRDTVQQVRQGDVVHSVSRPMSDDSSENALLAKRDTVQQVRQGDVVLAAITSCANTSNPYSMIIAGLLAKHACEAGIVTKPWVKTSLAPGSRVVTRYLRDAGLLEYMEKLGFNVVGYGCTTCIGNSGSLIEHVEKTIKESDIAVCAILSGNRNFESRIHPLIKLSYLGAPVMVVAYALAGTLLIDLYKHPIAFVQGKPVYFADILPDRSEVFEYIGKYVEVPGMYQANYANLFDGDEMWQKLDVAGGDIYDWQSDSTYIARPPFFEERPATDKIEGARIFGMFGDNVTTDHISPAGPIADNSPAALYLVQRGVSKHLFNTYGSRRGNHDVMMRGTFANTRLRNELVPNKVGYTVDMLSGEIKTFYDVAMGYSGVPLVVIAGEAYGTGSSRDWAAKGPLLLGVQLVIACSFESIHRSNLVRMGILPLAFENPSDRHNITGYEILSVSVSNLQPKGKVQVHLTSKDGAASWHIDAKCMILTQQELVYYMSGGIMGYTLAEFTKA